MEVTQTSEDGLKREFKVVIAAEEIEEKIDARLIELSRTIRLPGFRPGKVPTSLLKTRYGGAVRGEVLEDAVKEGSQQAIMQNDLRPAVQPKIDVTNFEEGGNLEYTMSVEVMPEFEPVDVSKLKLERLVSGVTDGDVEETLKRLAEQTKSFTPAGPDHAARSGDAVVIDFVGKLDGEAFDGGSAQDHQIELGSSSFVGTFEDQLIGVKAGDHRDLDVTFPEDYYPNKNLAGKAALFEVDVKEVKTVEPAAIDDGLAKSVGMETLDALRSAARGQIENERATVSRARLKRSLLDALAEKHDFEAPPSLVEIEVEAIWAQLQEDLKRADQSLEDMGRSEDEAKEEYRRLAKRRVRLGLLISEIGRRNNIEVQQDELNRAMVEQARNYPGEERKILDYFQQHPEAADQLRGPLFEDKVVDFIIEMAQVTEREVSIEELLREPELEEAEPGSESKTKTKSKAKSKSKSKAKTKTKAKTKKTAAKEKPSASGAKKGAGKSKD